MRDTISQLLQEFAGHASIFAAVLGFALAALSGISVSRYSKSRRDLEVHLKISEIRHKADVADVNDRDLRKIVLYLSAFYPKDSHELNFSKYHIKKIDPSSSFSDFNVFVEAFDCLPSNEKVDFINNLNNEKSNDRIRYIRNLLVQAHSRRIDKSVYEISSNH